MLGARHFALAVVLAVGVYIVLLVNDQHAGNYLFYWWTFNNVTFATLYGFRSPWRATNIGRGMMYYSLSCSIVGVQGTVGLLWPGYPWRTDIRQALFLLIVMASTNMLLTMISIQQETRRMAAHQELDDEWANPNPP